MKMCFRIIYLSVIVSISVLGTVFSQEHVCLKAYDLGDAIQMNCSVDRLKHQITFKNPSGDANVSCQPPIMKQCDPNLRQDKNTTTLLINKSDDIYGTWTCYHGTNIGSDSVTINKQAISTCDPSNTSWKDTAIGFIAAFTLLLLLFLAKNLNAAKRCFEWILVQFESQRGDQQESQALLGREDDEIIGICKACTLASMCAICSDCEMMFCEICCTTHKRSKPGHKVCQIDHVLISDFDVDCKECRNKTAAQVCMNCIRVMCDSCCKYHAKINKTHKIKTLVLSKSRRRQRNETERLSEIKHQYTIITGTDDVQPRICGLSLIEDGRIVIAEYHCKELRIYKRDALDITHDLKQEPKGMAHLDNNRVAITFPHERQIKLYEIDISSVKEIDKFLLVDKPFSIAFNQNHFAVELGEGDDGLIVILNSEGKTMHKIKNTSGFAYFTGNTIRLALDMKSMKVFVAALSKKSVSCVDFEGNVLWRQAVPSPRGIVFVGNVLSDKNMLVASKRWNIIFAMNSDDGKNDIIMSSGSVEGPRYIDYNLSQKLFCIQVDNGNILVYRFDITEI